jgi:exosome complex exonuclease DIS3/RRP44
MYNTFFYGIILQIVREHYLRDDIWCGSNICTTCAHQNQELVLDEIPQSKNKVFRFPHYILLDTCVVLNQVSHTAAVALL